MPRADLKTSRAVSARIGEGSAPAALAKSWGYVMSRVYY